MSITKLMTKCQRKILKILVDELIMVWVESKKDTLGAILVDGYVPSVGSLKLSFKKLSEELNMSKMKLAEGVYHYVYRNKIFSDRLRLNFFMGLVSKFRRIFCPHKYRVSQKNRLGTTSYFLTPCHYEGINVGQSFKDYLSIGPPTFKYRNVESELNIIEKERTHEKEVNPHLLYLQNIVYYRIDNEFYCKSAERCCKNWINRLNFKVKEQNEYKNYSSFKNAWKKLLYHELRCQKVMPGEDFLIFQYKRYLL